MSEIAAKTYHPRDREASPFFVLVRDYFGCCENTSIMNGSVQPVTLFIQEVKVFPVQSLGQHCSYTWQLERAILLLKARV